MNLPRHILVLALITIATLIQLVCMKYPYVPYSITTNPPSDEALANFVQSIGQERPNVKLTNNRFVNQTQIQFIKVKYMHIFIRKITLDPCF
jgi:hypothetical protein